MKIMKSSYRNPQVGVAGKSDLFCFQDVALELLLEQLQKQRDLKGIIVEGYPRTVQQAQQYEKYVSTHAFICSRRSLTWVRTGTGMNLMFGNSFLRTDLSIYAWCDLAKTSSSGNT